MDLHFKQSGSGFPLLILHGLMGSLDNWQTLAKSYAEHFATYTIDQRNHGRSPHTAAFSYTLLTDDLRHFLDKNKIDKCHLMGHSMGGKVAMHFALQYPDRVEKLIVVDIAPSVYENRHTLVFQALNQIDLQQLTDRKEAENTLRSVLQHEPTVQFLMKNLYRDSHHRFQWRFNLSALEHSYDEISDGIHSHEVYLHPTLFVKGEKSDYIHAGNYSDIMDLFPNNELIEIPNAGHWVHAENPTEFVKATLEFLGRG